MARLRDRLQSEVMFRVVAIASLVVLVGCADQSRGAALGECRQRYFLQEPAAQGTQIPECMRAKSFQMTSVCNPVQDRREWDWQVQAFTYDNQRCYRPIGSITWITTLLSPM